MPEKVTVYTADSSIVFLLNLLLGFEILSVACKVVGEFSIDWSHGYNYNVGNLRKLSDHEYDIFMLVIWLNAKKAY